MEGTCTFLPALRGYKRLIHTCGVQHPKQGARLRRHNALEETTYHRVPYTG